MVVIYTSFNCSSCKKAKQWLKAHGVKFEEHNLFSYKFTHSDLDLILKNCIRGFDDIIAKRSKIFKNQKIDLEKINTVNIKQIIMDNPGILKRPIIIEDDKIQIGYNVERIRIFLPKKLRNYIMKNKNMNIHKEREQYSTLLNNFFLKNH